MLRLDCVENLINEYPEYKYVWDRGLPKGLPAICVGGQIIISPHLSTMEKHQWLAEEIGHQRTSYGDIINDSLEARKQELVARQWGYIKLISLGGLIACWKSGMETAYEVADFFEVSEEYLWRAINSYRVKFGSHFIFGTYEFDLTHGIQIINK